MNKIAATISIDRDIKDKAKKILKEKAIKFSTYIEMFLVELIQDYYLEKSERRLE